MLTARDFQSLAAYLVDRHGAIALSHADRAVDELVAQGETERADAWRALRSLVVDMLAGRIGPRTRITIQ